MSGPQALDTATESVDAPLQGRPVADRDSLDHLELLAVMSQEFVTTRDLNATLSHAVNHIRDYVEAEAGALFMLDEKGETLCCQACNGPVEITGLTIACDQGIVGQCVQQDIGRIVRDVADDPDFTGAVDAETGFTTRSILCAPMSVKGERIGAIELINKRGGDGLFDDNDLYLLQALAASAGMAIKNARMSEQLVEQERVERELELAAEIQRSLIPGETPDGFALFGVNYPARVVSGDFFDYFPLADGRVMFSLGDVSGKGMNAALMMAKTASLLRCLGKSINEPGRLLSLVNDEICETSTRGMFVTIVTGVYDPATGHVRLANAGHEPPLIQDASGNFREVEADAPPLGIAPALAGEDGFPETDFHLDGGAFYVFTDGITEGYTAPGEELGVEGFKRLVMQHWDADMSTALRSVADAINGSGLALRDDITVLAIDDRVPERAGLVDRRCIEPGASDPLGEKLISIRVTADASRLKIIRNSVRETALFCGFDETHAGDVVLAVDEACQNIIRHAYGGRPDGDIQMEIRRRGDEMIITLRDFAEVIDVARVKPRDLDDVRPGGLGTHLMREIMDAVDFLPPPFDGGNLLRMVKKLPQREP